MNEPTPSNESQADDSLQGSLALSFDPTENPVPSEQGLSIPLQPAAEEATFAPLWLGIIAFIILGGLIGGLFLSSTQNNQGGQFQAANPIVACQVQALQDVNVRGGPGFEYPREWILATGDSRQVRARHGTEWLQIAKGWIPKTGLQLSNATACNQLAEETSLTLFNDDIDPPKTVLDLGWNEVLSENFASNLNEWLPNEASPNAAIREGELTLFASKDNPSPLIFPQKAAAYQSLTDAYFAWSGEWIASDLAAEVSFIFRQSDTGYYEVTLRRNGILILQRVENGAPPHVLEQANQAIASQDGFTLGILIEGSQIAVYLGNIPVVLTTDDTFTAGTYAFALRGESASFSISRFEIKTPLNPE